MTILFDACLNLDKTPAAYTIWRRNIPRLTITRRLIITDRDSKTTHRPNMGIEFSKKLKDIPNNVSKSTRFEVSVSFAYGY